MAQNNHHIVASVCTVPVGATFFDWSVLWLSGNTNVFYLPDQQWIPISQNPVVMQGPQSNAHNHQKNHPDGHKKTVEALSILKSLNGAEITSLVCCQKTGSATIKDLGIAADSLHQEDVWQMVLQHQAQDLQHAVKLLESEHIPCVYLAFDSTVPLYQYRARGGLRDIVDHNPLTQWQYWDRYRQLFFPESLQAWNINPQTPVWDIREMLALTMMPFKENPLWNLELEHQHLWISCQDWWFDTDTVVTKVMDYYGLSIDPDRWTKWLEVVPQWQKIQNKQLAMQRQLDHLVRCIVQGKNTTLPNLDLFDEALIQHCLIRHHDLNLKTWGLDKFPKDSIELTHRLEPNSHVSRSTS